MHRRDFTTHLLRAGALAALPLPAAERQPLRDVANTRHLLAGAAVSYRELQREDCRALLAREASILVSENDMKWQSIHPAPDRYDYTRADALLAFAKTSNAKVRGHNLCWHQQLPRWFPSTATSGNAGELLRAHIAEVAGHYAGRIHSWDVVNEAVFVEDGRPDGLRKSPWLELAGPSYIDLAFTTAAKADPQAILTYNDYDLEQDTEAHEAKRRAVLALLKGLRARNVPVQALGIQSHLVASTSPYQWSGFHRFLDGAEKLGLTIFITELDVDDTALPADITDRDRQVAACYQDFLSNALKHHNLQAILTWGFTDPDTWLNHFHPRKDGTPQRPLPFDGQLQPKPAYFAMEQSIEAAPRR
jgi:endo-1,4-beta-xylanase